MGEKVKTGEGKKRPKGKGARKVIPTSGKGKSDLDKSIHRKLMAGRWDFLTGEERARAEQLGLKEKKKELDPLKQERLRLLELEYQEKIGTLIEKGAVKTVWTKTMEKLMSVLERHLNTADYNAVIRDLKRELEAMGSELSFEPSSGKVGK